ncbi:MAG: hypothetical protein KDA85_04935 [Planctomycetaceae bacterium]|nr:hypothetical protein [Planctomycetaceae bacterium]
MDSQFLLAVISRWLHVGTAIVLIGGTFFMRMIVLPSVAGGSEELLAGIRKRWQRVLHPGIAIFILSGFYNFWRALPDHSDDGLYHGLVGTKILLAFGIFFLASALTGRSAGTQKFRDQPRRWLGVILLLATVIVGISGFVKVRGPASGAPTANATETPDAGE